MFRNDAFTFWSLEVDATKRNILPLFAEGQLRIFETRKNFSQIPLVSCSMDFNSLFSSIEEFNCFNGSSEEVKEQIITHYINKFCEKNGLETFKELTAEELAQNCTEMIHADKLEVRIPTYVNVESWKTIPSRDIDEDYITNIADALKYLPPMEDHNPEDIDSKQISDTMWNEIFPNESDVQDFVQIAVETIYADESAEFSENFAPSTDVDISDFDVEAFTPLFMQTHSLYALTEAVLNSIITQD